MTKLRTPGVLAAVVAASVLAAGTALATTTTAVPPKTYRFSASYTGKGVVVITDNNAKISSVSGLGTATLPVGKSKLSGTGAGVGSDPCGTWGGAGAITTAKGKLNFTILPTGGSACGDESGQTFTLSGRAVFKGGTARYLRAKGSFKFTGTFTKSTGAFSVKFLGTLTA